MVKIILSVFVILQQLAGLFVPVAHAGGLENAKVTVSDSRAGHAGTSHTFEFTTSTTGIIASISFQYCTSSTGACTTPSGLVTTEAVQQSVSGIGSGSSNTADNGTIYYTVSSPSSVPSDTTITIPYATITNPTSINTSHFVIVSTRDGVGTVIDSEAVAFATLTANSLTVSAEVGSTLQADIQPVTSGTVNGQQINMTNTTSDTIPFGILTSGSSKVAAHDVTVSTNASHGYQITVRAGNPPLSSGANKIDAFTGINASPTVWSAPNGTSSNTNTGFVGYTTEDTSLCTGSANRFSSDRWAGMDTTDSEIICNDGIASNGETTRIGWRAEINSLQPSGSYTGVFTLVITPTY